ncbi:MAG: hypothetical protein VKN72_04835 [Nostocales cyanobacterium 94392]|nr:hypothetical protein [Nostocales cyanobacterium 94392]
MRKEIIICNSCGSVIYGDDKKISEENCEYYTLSKRFVPGWTGISKLSEEALDVCADCVAKAIKS